MTDRGKAATACAAVIEVLGPAIRSAQIDVHSDSSPEHMAENVRHAEAQLTALAEGRNGRGSDPVGLMVNTGDPEWSAVETYAAWSIHAQFTGADGENLATFHDSGYSVVAALTDDEVAVLRARLATVAPVTLLSDIQDRRRAEKRAARRSRMRAWLRR